MKSTCVEWFAPDGVCGRPASHVVQDPIEGSWAPRCPRCARFYALVLVRPMTPELDRRIARLQRRLDVVNAGQEATLRAKKAKKTAKVRATRPPRQVWILVSPDNRPQTVVSSKRFAERHRDAREAWVSSKSTALFGLDRSKAPLLSQRIVINPTDMRLFADGCQFGEGVSLRVFKADGTCDSIGSGDGSATIDVHPDGRIEVKNLALFPTQWMTVAEHARASALADQCGALRTENDDLLRENARLRRRLEAAERKAKR